MYDVGATVLVNLDLAHCLHLFYPVDCKFSLGDLLLPSVQLFFKLLDLVVLLSDFRTQTFPVKLSSSLFTELLSCLNLSPASFGTRLKQMHGPSVRSYKIEKV